MALPTALGGEKPFTSTPIIKPDFDRFTDTILPEIETILRSNMVTGVNIKVAEFEKKIQQVFQVRPVAVSSCTSGMVLAMQAMGITNAEVIMPSFSFSATAHMAYWNNNSIKFADISKDTLNIDPDHLQSLITSETKAILAVHMYGNPANIKELEDIASDKNIHLLFDGAHAFGSKYRGKHVGAYGDVTSFSMSPTKIVSSIEGGIVTSPNNEILDAVDKMRNYGNLPSYECPIPGLNARMSEIHAAIGITMMSNMDEFIKNRGKYANIYTKLLSEIPGIRFQKVNSADTSTYKDFSIFIDENEFGISRDLLSQALAKAGISTKFYFYPPMHKLKPYQKYYREKLPNTEWATTSVLSLPIWNYMDEKTIEKITEQIELCHKHAHQLKNTLK